MNLGIPNRHRLQLRMTMEHHQCFHIYIVKMRVTRVSNTVFFKHQYIANPQVTPDTLVIKAALELTYALKGTVSCMSRQQRRWKKFASCS
jgi:hypothetical protein